MLLLLISWQKQKCHKKYKHTTLCSFGGASKKVGIEINAEQTEFMLMSYHQNAVQNKIKDRSSKMQQGLNIW
jgi:hypothetical protein